MFRVRMTNVVGDLNLDYCVYIADIADVDGELVWVDCVRACNCPDATPHVAVEYTTDRPGKWHPGNRMPFVGCLIGYPVAATEAEELTGYHMPAAMDRLRELVDAARDLFAPVEAPT